MSGSLLDSDALVELVVLRVTVDAALELLALLAERRDLKPRAVPSVYRWVRDARRVVAEIRRDRRWLPSAA